MEVQNQANPVLCQTHQQVGVKTPGTVLAGAQGLLLHPAQDPKR